MRTFGSRAGGADSSARKPNRWGPVVGFLALCAALLITACGDDDDGNSTAGSGNSPKKLHIAFAGIVKGDPTVEAMKRATEGLAKQRGWEFTYVNNNNDGPTAVTNAKLLANKGVDAVIEHQGDGTVMPTISKVFEAKGIPWITYSVPGPGAYFVGASAVQAGILAGGSLGEVARQKWDCQADLLVLLTHPALPGPNQRVLKVRDGFKKVCADMPDSKIVEVDAVDSSPAKAQEVSRNVLVAHPEAKRILFAALTDATVTGGLTAAKQLGRYDEAFAWGQDGTGLANRANPNPHLLGSVMYFLEGYPAYAMQVLDKIAAGDPPPKGKEDTAESPTAINGEECSMTAAEISKIPSLDERVTKLLESPKGTELPELYCPKGAN